MNENGERGPLGLLVVFLRLSRGLTQKDFGKAARVDQGDVSRYELGKQIPPEEVLRRMAAAVRRPWPVVVQLRSIYEAILGQSGTPGGPTGNGSGSAELERAILEAALLALSPCLIEGWEEPADCATPDEAVREAREIWAALAPLPSAERRRLLEWSRRAAHSWALAREIGEASVRAAAESAEEAMELARQALEIAGRVPGEDPWRSRVQGYCHAHVANALRVATDFAGADAALERAWQLWRQGDDAAPELLAELPEWRLLDLEGSLRREQRRFPEALARLDQALGHSGADPLVRARILLNKEHTYEAMGDLPRALAAVEESAPWVEMEGDRALLFALRFKKANHLGQLGRFPEAAAELPPLEELAAAAGQKLHQIRVRWLAARVAAGQERATEAEAGFARVVEEFTALRLPYEAALAALELAELQLAAGRTAEVRQLAEAMSWIFTAQGIAREALAAWQLFDEAARQEAATIALTRQVLAELEAPRRPALHNEEALR